MKLFLHELRGELRLYWRSRELAFFTFLLPMILFLLLGFAYGDDRIEKKSRPSTRRPTTSKAKAARNALRSEIR